MNVEHYKNCLLGKGITTGNLSAVYDFTGGSGNYVYNSLHTPENHLLSGSFLSSKNPGIIVSSNVSISEALTGLNSGATLYRVGKNNPSDSFTAVFDYDNNFCDVTGLESQVLVSTNDLGTGTSGFALGANQANRLFFEYYSGDTRKSYTIDQELSFQNTVFVNVYNNERLTFGFYDYETDELISSSHDVPDYVHSNQLYIGGLYSYTGTSHTGLNGHSREFILFNQSLDSTRVIKDCIECMFFTGFSYDVTTTLFDYVNTIGFSYSTQNVSGVTGTTYISQTVPHPTGGTTTILVESGMSGVVDVLDNIIPLTGAGGSGQEIVSGESFEYDKSSTGKASYGAKTITFAFDLASGDIVEAYYFNTPISVYNLNPINFSLNKSGYNNAFLFHNGLLNIEGCDFAITENVFTGAEIQGYDNSDAFQYNLSNETVYATPWSGLSTLGRILLNSGDYAASGGSGTQFFYPDGPQYLESGNDIYITGISGQVVTGFDLFLNGQKLIEDYDYHTGLTGSLPSIILSGADMPYFTADVTYTGSGNVSGWPNYPPSGITNVESGLLVFIEKRTDVNRTVTYFTGAGTSVNVTGYSEQIWVNGVRQLNGYDYLKTYPCSPSSGNETFNDDLFYFYNNSNTYFNID